MAKPDKIEAPNQLWELDIKDVFDRSIIDYHLGLSCTAADATRVLKNSLAKRGLAKGMTLPKIRTDNGPQFISNRFEETIEELGLIHERIPVKTPNMNAHIESFHSILEDECYSRNEFNSFKEAYSIITEYMEYYNQRRIHGSINFMAPNRFYEAFMSNSAKIEPFSA